jgi:predicted nucleotidyltransferase
MKPRGKAEQLVDLLRRYDPDRVYLFGSQARDEADDMSDIDIVIIMPTKLPFLDRIRRIAKRLPISLGAVDLLVYTPEEWRQMQLDGNAFAETIVEEGKVIYEKS